MFSVNFGLPNKFFSLKNRKLFLKIKNKGKKQLPNILLFVWLRRKMRGWENEIDINLQLHPHSIKQNSNTLFFIKKIVHGLLNFFI